MKNKILERFFASFFHVHPKMATTDDLFNAIQSVDIREGPRGPEGPVGPEGPEGPQGPQGDPAVATDIWRLYNPAGTQVIARTTSSQHVLINRMVEAKYHRSLNQQFADDTAVEIAMSSETSSNRGWLMINTNSEDYFWGFMQYTAIVTFHKTAQFNVVAGNGILTGTTGPDGFVNLRMFDGSLFIENRVVAGIWIGATVLAGSA